MKFSFCLALALWQSVAMTQTALQWTVFHPVEKQWIPAGTHGSVQEILMAKGELPDPFYGDNEKQFGWIEKYDWQFRTQFFLTEAQFNAQFLELEFPGIDTYAKVYLNDSLVFEADNAFRPYRLEMKKLVQCGYNRLRVVFTSPVNYHRATFDGKTTKLPAPNDVGEIAVSSMSRKPQYQFGWDWALRMNTIGFLKPVQIHAYDHNRLLLHKVDTKALTDGRADLNLSLHCAVKELQAVTLQSKMFGTFKFLNAKNGILNIPVSLDDPKLWWPRGQGPQHLYTDEWVLTTEAGIIIDSATVRFGIRTSELITENDQWGTSFYLKINGRPVFCKGGNYIPQSVFPAQVTPESTRELVRQMSLSNFNMVRIWGGGFYQEEALYAACDEAGIMVWQDLMFACAMYPGDDHFLTSVRQELDFQLPRIAAHPSVVLFNGNNEVDVAWKNWGFQSTYKIDAQLQAQMDLDYKNLFQLLAPEIVAAQTTLPYVHTSPLSNWGKDEYFDHGTMHYWGVWHGKDPITDFGLKTGRFNAEYGFQSFPEYSTLLTFSTKADWSLESAVMKHHQKSYVGNGMIRKHADILYGPAASFEDFVYYSQLTQARAVGIAISGHRTNAPRCMGTLYWQFNDCWPAPTWSGIDYFGNWKALQYEVQADFEDVAVLAKPEEEGQARYFLVSDQPENFETQLRFTVYDLKGEKLLDREKEIWIGGVWSEEIAPELQEHSFRTRNYVLAFQWKDASGVSKTRSFVHQPKKITKAPASAVQLTLNDIDPVAKTAVLKIHTKTFLKDFWVFSAQTGVHYSRNFLPLLPGTHEIVIHFEQVPVLADFGMHWL
jgi:beta-mannosidase